ncbi:MAG: bifunctional isocitrate dehydrogenase kinase/phosphatase [Pseudomonadales bacterium]|nr:bifunctional isocitrate dehydrogenase kinase/phosphatase [Pseudomonadales bacterium]
MSRTARRLAKAILNGFDAFFAEYKNITYGAQGRFERADWQDVHRAMRQRLDLYKEKVKTVAESARAITGQDLRERSLWQQAKGEYALIIQGHHNFEITQTFFNSVYCLVFGHEKIRDLHAFVMEPAAQELPLPEEEVLLRINCSEGLHKAIGKVLDNCGFNIPFEDRSRDIEWIVQVITGKFLPRWRGSSHDIYIETLESLFFRNKAAYLVGRIVSGSTHCPFILPILNNEQGAVYVDTVLHDPDDISIVFSFSRTYFMVDASTPSAYIKFLKAIMPNKEIFELYSAIGFPKHSKTVYYRRAVEMTLASDDQYIIAPGIKGMVMLVFTRDDFDYVYKVIKQRFSPPKETNREHVRACYALVKRWERGGRMADTQEFNNLAFDKRRFSTELMAELRREVPALIEENGNVLLLRHCYIERKMVPLNMYIQDCSQEQLYSVMDEYGNAIRQLAAGNLFPGDMLLKNFGVTRHGRVVFYDYDEICPLTECRFRHLPQPQTEDQIFASRPWYPVGPNDVFPEEFRLFFSGNQRARAVFDQLHSDLYDPDYWTGLQRKINSGYVADVFPYRKKQRFQNRAV